MDKELHLFALRNTLNEIRKTYPSIGTSFIFDETGQIMASNASIAEKDITRMAGTFSETMGKASVIGGVDSLTIEGYKATVNISSLNNLYLVTVASENPHNTQMVAVSRILILTVLDLLEKITPTLATGIFPETEAESTSTKTENATTSPQMETLSQQSTQETKPKNGYAAHQFMVESLKGLFIKSDTVHVDNEVLTKWRETSKDKAPEKVEIETFSGKTIQCKVKPIRDSKHAAKGVIQMPERVLNTLEIKKGELVRVKPVTE